MSRILDRMHTLMAQELARADSPLNPAPRTLDDFSLDPAAEREAMRRRARQFRELQRQSKTGKPHAR